MKEQLVVMICTLAVRLLVESALVRKKGKLLELEDNSLSVALRERRMYQ